MAYALHPLCTLFPRIEGKAFDDLVADIAANGLREPIITHDGMVLDGGNRQRACEAAGVEPHYVEFDGSSIAGYVLSKNLHRRHLTEGQRAAIVASTTSWETAQAVGRPGKSVHENTFSTQAQRAEVAGVSKMTQRRAEQVAKADPEKIKEVARGEKTLPKAIKEIWPSKPAAIPDPTDYFGPSEEEIQEALTLDAADNAKLHEILASDDPLGEAAREIKRLKSELAVVKQARDGYMNQLAEVVSRFKALKRKLEKLQK